MFKEHASKRLTNSRIAADMNAKPATLADGNPGVVLWVSDLPICVTKTEAIAFATSIADAVEGP